MSKTTTAAAEPVYAYQIAELRTEASLAGDYLQVAICEVALLGDYDTTLPLTDAERARLAGMNEQGAWAECERVINDARAMQD